MTTHVPAGAKAVVDETLIVTILKFVAEAHVYVVETGHGSMTVSADRVVALA